MTDKMEPAAWMDDGSLRSGSESTAFRVVSAETKSTMPSASAVNFTIPLYTADQVKELGGKLEKAEEARDRFQAMCRENYEAFTAMRNDINEVIGDMASQESTLRDGPEMTHECAAVVSAVKGYATTTEAALAEAREVIEPFADQAATFDSDGEEFVPDDFTPAIVTHTVGDLRRARAFNQANKGDA